MPSHADTAIYHRVDDRHAACFNSRWVKRSPGNIFRH
jgi:hypothetical protein